MFTAMSTRLLDASAKAKREGPLVYDDGAALASAVEWLRLHRAEQELAEKVGEVKGTFNGTFYFFASAPPPSLYHDGADRFHRSRGDCRFFCRLCKKVITHPAEMAQLLFR